MQKEEKIMVVLLSMAVLSLIIGYFGFAPVASAYSPESKVGDNIYVQGTILQKQMTAKGDNLLLTISNINIKVFISRDNGAKEVYNAIEKGDKVRIEGKVAQYKNALEIVVENAKDVKKI
ncbi:MAG: OB-fold nucleic acid binding domain-containing protein [Candidatus Methanoperedens sp.]|nr:OB-fold nucleic acid binding domain-containing protein [Candidatus Methanoperedens sp.]